MSRKFAEEVAQMFIEKMREGKAPWQRPWKVGMPGQIKYGMPYNPVSRRGYRGVNSLWLGIQPFQDQRWVTAKQAESVGAFIKKGEKGSQIVYYKFDEKVDAKDGNGKVIVDEKGKPLKKEVRLQRPMALISTVFNAEQVDGPLPALSPSEPRSEREAIELADEAIQGSGADIRHQDIDRAFYAPSADFIVMPPQERFHSTAGYYATLLHELGHWTGHETRLKRDLSGRMNGTGESLEKYAKEELRAEIASYMMGLRFGIGHDPSNHVAYVASWIKALEDDPYEIMRAATAAEQICQYVIALSPTLSAEMQAEAEAAQKYEVERKDSAVRDENGRYPYRQYLDVPREEKDEAKAFGARWDKVAVSWYAPAGVDVKESGLSRWMPPAIEPEPEPIQEAEVDGPVYTVSITYEVFTEASIEAGESAENGFEEQDMQCTQEELIHLIKKYGFDGASATAVSPLWLTTSSPVEDRNYFENGETKYFGLHLRQVNGQAPELEDYADLVRLAGVKMAGLDAYGTKIISDEDLEDDQQMTLEM